MYGVYVAAIALVWVFVSKTLALAMIALVIAAFLFAFVSVMWELLRERRHS